MIKRPNINLFFTKRPKIKPPNYLGQLLKLNLMPLLIAMDAESGKETELMVTLRGQTVEIIS